MDTTEQYIKKCDCPEIQKGHEPTESDLCVIKFMGYSIELIIGQTPARADRKDNRDLLKAGNTIWLPRQDDIQAMIRKYYAQKIDSKKPHDEWFPKGAVGLGYVLK